MALLVAETGIDYMAVPVRGLSGPDRVPFALHLATGKANWVLYQPADSEFEDRHEVRLAMEGVDTLYIRAEDSGQYARRVESSLDQILKDRTLAISKRAEILHKVAAQVIDDLFVETSDQQTIRRARRTLASTASLVLRDGRAFTAIRQVLGSGKRLADHALTVAFLSIGLAHKVLGCDPDLLLRAGMAGLLHDFGHLDHPNDPDDPDHPERGYQNLKRLKVPDDICQAALCHHERVDGSGYPRGLKADDIPVLARIVGLASTFHRVYSEQADSWPTGTYESLRVLAQVYRGCFDTDMTEALVQMFAY